MGGARPKATVQDQESYWLVKPALPSDAIDIPRLEFAVQRWGSASGMCFAHTGHHSGDRGLSVVRSLRFDRMVFNAIVGNDDDHPRNHAVH